MKILVVNAGSSSLKYQLFDMETSAVLAKGICERIGIDGSITHKRPEKADYKLNESLNDHKAAVELVLKLLCDPELGVISGVDEIGAVGHRIAHGGEKIRKSSILKEKELEYLESIVEINPLHGPPAISGVKACRSVMPNVEHVGVFDTSYYSTMEEKSYIYPIPYELYEKYKIRRYGFHGTSHRYVCAKAMDILGKKDAKIVTCHLGNGSSITASVGGKAIDTSMGFTPQEGVPMGTRSGSIDPTIVPYIMKKEGLSCEEAERLLNSKSGLLGISNISSDCRDLTDAMEAGDKRAKLAMDILVHHIKKIVGSYVAEMNGIDALVFTAGVGENDRYIRQGVCRDMSYLGIEIDEELNWSCAKGSEIELTKKGAKARTFIIPTNEEYMIALDTYNLIK
ncbi:MAG: acetate kinase [Clostridia bacterium]|nr:acetate kinase [Clostridia bacterium]